MKEAPSSELAELTRTKSTGESNVEDVEEPFDNDECEDAEPGGGLAPLHIESPAASNSISSRTFRSCQGRWISLSPSFHRHRAVLVLTVSALLISAGLAIVKRMYPTYLPSSISIFGGKSHPADAVCLLSRLSIGNLTSADSLNLNRRAPAFSGSASKLNGAQGGFLWQEDDAKTSKWRPQGVSTLATSGGRIFVLVSWYGRKDEGYSDRGARISFVDTTAMHSIAAKYPYRHVLLVDENYCTLPSIHAGGIEVVNNTFLYVADSREGQQGIRVFDMKTSLFEVPESLQSKLFGYRYVLRSTSFFHVPTKPSFIGNDPDLSMLLVGTYSHCGNAIGMHTDSNTCLSRPNNRLVWFEDGSASMTGPKPCSPLFSEMQGAVSVQTANNGTTLIVSCSYGPYADSHLHIVRNFDRRSCKAAMGGFKTLHYPAGLEDLHIEDDLKSNQPLRRLWGLTEFGTRMVFVTELDALLL